MSKQSSFPKMERIILKANIIWGPQQLLYISQMEQQKHLMLALIHPMLQSMQQFQLAFIQLEEECIMAEVVHILHYEYLMILISEVLILIIQIEIMQMM